MMIIDELYNRYLVVFGRVCSDRALRVDALIDGDHCRLNGADLNRADRIFGADLNQARVATFHSRHSF